MTTHEHLDELAKSFALKTLPDSEVELEGDIPFADIEPLQERALKHFAEEVELPGFRKGHVPLEMVKKRVGDIAIMEEAVEFFMRDFYPALITVREVEAIGRPEIRITKLAPGNPIGIIIKTAVYPTIELPKGWQTIHESIPQEDAPVVTDTEIDDALTSIRRAHAKANPATAAAAEEADSSPAASPITDVPAADTLPPLDDDFARSLGPFADLADLKDKMRQNLTMEKEQKARDTRRGKVIEALLAKADFSVPSIFVDSELEKILGQMGEDVKRYGMTMEDYLKRINKTEDDVRRELRDQATKRARLQLVLNKIAGEEKIEPDQAAVDEEMKHALEHFPEARPDLLKIHIETIIRNDKVLQMLEGKEVEKAKAPNHHDHEGHDHA